MHFLSPSLDALICQLKVSGQGINSDLLQVRLG